MLLVVRMHLAAFMLRSTVEVHIDKSVRVGRRVVVQAGNKRHTVVKVGAGSKIGDGVRLRLNGGVIDLGPGVDIRGNSVLSVDGGSLTLVGPNIVSWGSTIHCADSVHLAKFVYAGEYVTIVDSSHFFSEEDAWSYHNSRAAPIRIEQDVWVCPKATITSGVTIGDHTIVASNTVVVKDVPSGVLVSGVPGKVIRELDLPWK